MNLTTCGKIFFIDKWSCANHVAFMNLYIFKGKEFHINGKLSIKVYQKPENLYMHIPFKSAHPRHTIKNYVLGDTCYFSKGIDDTSVVCHLSLKPNQNAKKQTNSAFMTVLSSRNRSERLCCVFPGLSLIHI